MSETITQYVSLSWVYWTLLGIYAVTILSIIGVIISENRNPIKSLAWVTILLVVPALGLVLYILFGRSIKNKRFITRRNRRKIKKHEPAKPFNASSSGLTDASCAQIKQGQSLAGAPFYPDNNAEIFADGRQKFEALFEDIRNARKYIYLQYYIIENDNIGNALSQLLIEKARQGVEVKIIYDHVGSFRTPRRFFKRLREAGIEVYPFFKVRFPLLGSRINWRNHRKICLIDGNVGYIGGMNVADRYIEGTRHGIWRDLHLRVTGPILRSLNHSFVTDWSFMGRPVPDAVASGSTVAGSQSTIGMQLLTSGPNGQWNNIGMQFLKAIGSAHHCIYIQTPYFLPTDGLQRALQAAALAKIDVRIMMPRRPDSRMLRYASASYISECLRAGIKIYLYDKGMLHSKAIIVDDEFASVGSTNFDFRSFEHNFESNLFIYSREFNARLKQRFYDDITDSTRVLPYDWKTRPLRQRILESLTRLLAPIL